MIIHRMIKLCPLHLQDLNLEVIKEETGFIQQLDMIEPKIRVSICIDKLMKLIWY